MSALRRASRQLSSCLFCLIIASLARVSAQLLEPSGPEVSEFDSLFAPAESGPAAPVPAEPDTKERRRSDWQVSGTLRSENAGWSREPAPGRVAKLRTALDARVSYQSRLTVGETSGQLQLVLAGHAEYDAVYQLYGDAYDAATRDAYQWQLIRKEAFVSVRLGRADLSVGRQVANWGQGEILSVLDVMNPRDLREPGMTDLTDLRLGVVMSKAAISLGDSRLEMIGIHEAFFGLLAPPLGRLSPLRALLLENPSLAQAFEGKDLRYRHRPSRRLDAWEATQYFGRWAYTGHGYDLTVQGGSTLDMVGVPSLPRPGEFSRSQIELSVYHPRYTTLGHSGAVTLGPFLLRWEASFDVARPLAVRRLDTPILQIDAERHNQINGLVGLTYFGRGTDTAAMEMVESYVFDNPERRADSRARPLWPVELPQLAVRGDFGFAKEQLRVAFMGLAFGTAAAAARLELSWVVVDALRLTLGYMLYRSGSRFTPLYGFDRNDRAMATLRWDFSLL